MAPQRGGVFAAWQRPQAAKRPVAGSSDLPPILVILDMNGVLLLRDKNTGWTGTMRPHLETLLHTLFEDLKGQVQVAVWSSMMEKNLQPLVYDAFGDYAKSLTFIWDQTCCTQRWVQGMRKPLLRKDLVWLTESHWKRNVPDRVVLIDDDPIKCTENPKGTAIHPSTWAAVEDQGDDELLRLAAYLKELVASGSSSVRDFVNSTAFEEFTLPGANGASTAPSAKRRRKDCSSWSEDEEEAESTPSFEVGEEVDAYWPDDGSWLLAKVREVSEDGSLTVIWKEDGSESDVPPSYARRRLQQQEKKPALAPAKKKQLEWQRMESRRAKGVFYYYNSATGESSSDPPKPWQAHQAPGQLPGVFYYYNPVTGKESWVKPDLSE